MITIRKSNTRGFTELQWLKSFHTFSFGAYHDPLFMGFGDLRVINDDTIQGGGAFGMHPHQDMEIITYVTRGALEHNDSLGTKARIGPGEVQRMSAGTGIRHSESNASQTDPVHLLQIWILPEKQELSPSYEQKNFAPSRKPGHLTLLVSPDGQAESLMIHQDAFLSVLDLEAQQSFQHTLNEGRMAWIQVIEGHLELNGHLLTPGDGATVTHEKELSFMTQTKAEILIFDLAQRL